MNKEDKIDELRLLTEDEILSMSGKAHPEYVFPTDCDNEPLSKDSFRRKWYYLSIAFSYNSSLLWAIENFRPKYKDNKRVCHLLFMIVDAAVSAWGSGGRYEKLEDVIFYVEQWAGLSPASNMFPDLSKEKVLIEAVQMAQASIYWQNKFSEEYPDE